MSFNYKYTDGIAQDKIISQEITEPDEDGIKIVH